MSQMSKFQQWFCSQGISCEHEAFARDAWNAAIASASRLVAERIDWMEPWLKPRDVIDVLYD